MKDKVGVVMKEFKRGDLKSSSGQKVTNPKQAIAIALSEAGKSKKGSGMKKMAAGGMPMVEKGGKMVPAFAADGKGKMAKGGMTKKMASGGLSAGHKQADGIAKRGKTRGMEVKMARGGLSKAEVKKADAAGRKVTRDLKYDDMKDKMMGMKKGGMAKKMRSGGKTC